MTLIYQKFIRRSDLKDNPKQLYIFGDNTAQYGMAGQAKEMRGEPNAFGIPTKWRPGLLDKDYFRDSDYPVITSLIRPYYFRLKELLEDGMTVVWPEDGIGTGLSALPRKAPKIWAAMEEARLELEKIK